jgi:hypothetical protein
MEPTTILLTATGLTAFIIIIPAILRNGQLLKRSQWQAENGHDRSERREFEWYWNKKKVRIFPAPDH